MSFTRFSGMSYFSSAYWSTPYDAAENELLADEKRVKALIKSSASELSGAYPTAQQQVGTQFTEIANATIDKPQYRATSNTLAKLEKTLYALRILKVIDYLVTRLPETMRGDDNATVILQALAPGASTRQEVVDVGSEHALGFAKARINNVIDALNEVDRRLAIDRPGKVVKHIELTGSDLHNRGRQVVIVTYDNDAKEVYKPRSVQPDANLVGRTQTSGFGFLNSLSENVDLPTIGFAAKGEGPRERGYVEFKRKTRVIADRAVGAYYEQLGQVAVASKLFGATDLHQDNVMAVEGGRAAIIDAETSFLPYVMAAKSYAVTGLPSALKEFASASGGLASNAFVTESEEERLGEDELKPETVARLRENDLLGSGTYRDEFIRGIRTLIATVDENETAIVNHLWELLGQTTRARYVPLETTEFKGYLRSYHSALARKRPNVASDVVDEVVRKIVEESGKEGFELNEELGPHLRTALVADLQAGDIPVFFFAAKTNALRYRGKTIGDSKLLRGGKDFVAQVVRNVAQTDWRQVVKDLLEG
ncbi:MAG: DUF4135 domain-containing protein [Candidatus Eremiobacteraeota bacterium]|nr:DUF4135 domain-containing protein [Candidatus Eremiobacteraeota bacterium]MBV9409653.1 DUF4135 domain-containing protein [Candidatus Eremiobacteraeota bacterium]